MASLDEVALRKPGFREGYRVKLGDGQEWSFPRPLLHFFPAITDDGDVVLAAQHTHDRRYRELRDELVETDGEDRYNQMRIQVCIAAHLLLANYDLDSRTLRELLPVVEDDAANDEMWGGLIEVILARPPKPSADGSAVA